MKEREAECENMVGMTTGEAMRVADRNAAGCLVASAGALALLAALACWAGGGCAADRAVAAYSVCESCGRMLDGAVAACREEGEGHE